MSLKVRLLLVAIIGVTAKYQQWPAWSFFLVVLLILLDPETRWNELLDAIKSRKTETPAAQPPEIPKPKILVVRLPSKDAEGDFCKCGYPGCIGHEVLDKNVVGAEDAAFPGLTSPEVMAQMMERGSKFVRFDMEISRVPGNR